MIMRFETSTGDALTLVSASNAARVGNGVGRIVDSEMRADRVIRIGPGRFHAGLINAHDHLHRNHYPRLGSPPYDDAYEWGADIHARCASEIARAKTLGRRDALLFGALKNILGGATAVVHHDAWEPAFDDEFPIRVIPVRTLHSLGLEGDGALAEAAGANGTPLCIHLAEGVNRRAADEIHAIAKLGLLDARLLAVHVVGADAEGVARLGAAGAGVVWCPTSNRFLFGATAPPALLAEGVDVLLGTDALLTGDGTLFDELRAAHEHGHLDDHRLNAAVGRTAARRLGVPAPSLEPGARADVMLLRTPLLEARPADLALVLVGGRAVLADEDLAPELGLSGELLDVGGVRKIVPAPLAHAAERALALFPENSRVFE